MVEYDGKSWQWVDLPADTRPSGYENYSEDELVVDADGTLLIGIGLPGIGLLPGIGPSLKVRQVTEASWVSLLYDSTYVGSNHQGRNAMGYHEGTLTVATNAYTDSFEYVRIRHYQADAGWTATEKSIFRFYRLPLSEGSYVDFGARQPALAHRDGQTAMILAATGDSSRNTMKLFRRRAGTWDSTMEFPKVSTPSLAIERDETYMAFSEERIDSTGVSLGYGRAALRKYGPGGWEDVGPGDIFGRDARAALVANSALILKFHQGIPFVGAGTSWGYGFLVARLRNNRWEILVEPRFQGFYQGARFRPG